MGISWEYVQRRCHCCPMMLFLCIVGQCALMLVTIRATWVMRHEWQQVMGKYRSSDNELHVKVVKMVRFKGPVYVVVPVSCADQAAIVKEVEDNQADAIAEETSEAASRRLRAPAFALPPPPLPSMAGGVASFDTWRVPDLDLSIVARMLEGEDEEEPAPAGEDEETPPEEEEGVAPTEAAPTEAAPEEEVEPTEAAPKEDEEVAPTEVAPAEETEVAPTEVAPTEAPPTEEEQLAAEDAAALKTSGVIEVGDKVELKQWTCNCFLDALPFFGPTANRTFTLEACGKTIVYHTPHFWTRYLSLMELQKIRKGGSISSGREMHTSRSMLYFMNIFVSCVTMGVKYSLTVVDLAAKLAGPRYIQLWQNDRTRCDRFIEGVLLHSNAIVFNLALQLSLTSLYLTFWRGSYFVMEFIPSVGMWIFFVLQIGVTFWMVIDRVNGWMVKVGDWYLGIFWIVVGFWTIFVTLPMLGYCFTSIDFVMKVWQGEWIGSYGIFSPRFTRMAHQAMGCAFGFVLLAILDTLVIFFMDLTDD